MAVVSMMRLRGDVSQLGARMESRRAAAGKLDERYGRLVTVAARTDDGILVVNLWESDEAGNLGHDPDMLEPLHAAGLPEPAFEAYDVLHYDVRPEAVAG